MARLLALTVFLIHLPKANALNELFTGDALYMDRQTYVEALEACSYSFGWGRSTITLTNGLGEQSTCTFSNTDGVSQGASMAQRMNAIYRHHYTCTDGSNVVYTTNFFGIQLGVHRYMEGYDGGIECR